jgi:hypothetical protein
MAAHWLSPRKWEYGVGRFSENILASRGKPFKTDNFPQKTDVMVITFWINHLG